MLSDIGHISYFRKIFSSAIGGLSEDSVDGTFIWANGNLFLFALLSFGEGENRLKANQTQEALTA